MSPGVVVFVTGLPSSGKSTLALKAAELLRQQAVTVSVLDGDAVRASLVPPHDYSPAGRASFYESIARLAALLANQGHTVIVAATAHLRSFRSRACELAPAYLEVWVDTPQLECEQRDTKGLYAAGRSGETDFVPGIAEAYEPPLDPAVVAHGGHDWLAVRELCQKLSRLEPVSPPKTGAAQRPS